MRWIDKRAAVLMAASMFVAGCASGPHCNGECAVLALDNAHSLLDEDIVDAFNANCASEVALKELDGRWVPWYSRRSSTVTGIFEMPVDPGVHALLFSANFDRVGPLRPIPPASHRGEPRELEVELEEGKRYFFCAALPEDSSPEDWEPAVYWVEDRQHRS
jgi:hypothetical protein